MSRHEKLEIVKQTKNPLVLFWELNPGIQILFILNLVWPVQKHLISLLAGPLLREARKSLQF